MSGYAFHRFRGDLRRKVGLDHTDARVSNREQRKQRRENAARGIPPEPKEKVFKTPPDPSRLSTRGNKGGLVQGKGKQPKQKEKDQDKDG